MFSTGRCRINKGTKTNVLDDIVKNLIMGRCTMVKAWKPFSIFAVLALIFLPAATAVLVEPAKNIVEASPGVGRGSWVGRGKKIYPLP
jgi:hypothetical protein